MHEERLHFMVPVMMTISGDLIAHVRFILYNALNHAISGNVARYGINAGARFAFSAYITAVASVEAFLNEQLLGPVAQMLFRDSSLWSIKYDKLEIQTKLIIVPQMLFGRLCTGPLRIIISPPQPGTMPQLNPFWRGHGHGVTPVVLPTRSVGSHLALRHVVSQLAQAKR